MHYLELGGAEMSLIGLLGALDPAKVDIDLFIYSHQGPLMRFIPDYVNLIKESTSYSSIERPLSEALKKGQIGVVGGRLLAKLMYKRYRRHNPAMGDDGAIMQYIGDYVTPWLPKIKPEVEYDLCISFLTPHNIGRDKIRAKKRLAWIHTDYSTVSVDADRELPVWGAYDYIASISEEVTNAFVKTFPTLESKIIPIENVLSTEFIRSRANSPNEAVELPGSPALLSIGRFCTAKNYDNVPDIARRLVYSGWPDLKWYIIGYGGDEALIRARIREAGMEQNVILLGKKDNPYPYIAACDVYVQPSRYEGKSVTVREAQILHKPVIVTAYPTAPSQISHGVDGVIVPLDNEGCARGISDFLADDQVKMQIVKNLQSGDLSNISEVNKIYELLK